MQYIEKQKFNINDLVALKIRMPVVVVIEPDAYLADLYAKYIMAAHYKAHIRRDILDIHSFLEQVNPHVILFNPHMHPSTKVFVAELAKIRKNLPSVILITIGQTTETEEIKHYMEAGIASHINRRLTRPGDIIVIIQSLLKR